MRLQTRLSGLLLGVLAVGLLLFGGVAYLSFQQQQQRELGALLERELARVRSLLETPAAAVGAQLLSDDQGDLTLQFVSPDNEVVLPLGAEATLPRYDTPTLVRVADERWQLVAVAPWQAPDGSVRGTIRLGLDVSGAIGARQTLFRSLLLSGVLVVLVAALLGIWLLRRSLRPLGALAGRARAVDPADPQPIRYDGPADEVADLAAALNTALAGIHARHDAERAALAEVAHELAAPLSVVAGHLASVAAHEHEDTRLQAAHAAAQELLYTSQDLLTLARGELERPLDLELFDLRDVVSKIAREYPGIRLCDRPDQPAEMAGNPQRMAQVVRNLVRNAVQASGGTQTVWLELTPTPDEHRLTVGDHGPGIAPDELPHLFERFYTRRGGVGVGLSVARQIAEQHGGSIEVSSELHEGSCFTVRVPSLQTQFDEADEQDEPLGETEA